MGLNKFEKLIKDNQEYFEQEPSMDHMDKFFFKIKEKEEDQKKAFLKNDQRAWWIGIAATISLLISIGWFISIQDIPSFKNQQMGMSLELNEIKTYYTKESDQKLKEINQCANQSPTTQKLIASTETQLKKLTFNADKLENKLITTGGNKKLEMAYIQSLKVKNDLVNQMHHEICKPSYNSNLLTQ